MKRREQLGPAPATETTQLSSMRTASGVRERVRCTNLGHAPTRFVGRRREMSELRTLLVEHPIVSVVGVPGIGKSRLASELALALLDEYAREGGAWRVDVGEARDADTACAAVARTLAISATSPGRSASAAIATALAARGRTLIVLDGVDGCAAPLARALSEWVREAPNVRWIVTSRVRLGKPGEAALDLGSMATMASGGGAPDAVWLFVDRARAARSDLVLDERTAQQPPRRPSARARTGTTRCAR
jgi:predicted ATPase